MAEYLADDAEVKFVEPKREIKTLASLSKWINSEAYRDYVGFILTINQAVTGKKLTDECHVSEAAQGVVELLETVEKWIDEIPACDQPQRFGNKAYRDWSKRLLQNSHDLILPLLPENYKEAMIELKAYIHDAFGNSTRIDYGTGHEACFILFLCCLYKLKVLTEQDHVAIVNKIFKKYLDVMRKLQLTYRMEPAGSQGVWGLDDFQFVSYIWGSSQLNGNQSLSPDAIPSESSADKYYKEYMLFGCIKFIHAVKSGPFGEHSNVLYGISSIQHWSKVNSGLMKMYKAEVLSKFPVIQHFVFGTLISIQAAK